MRYSAAELIRMRLLALMVGRGDLNDAQTLADDPGFAMAFGRKDLPSTATLCRFERKIDNRVIEAGNQFLLDMYFRYGFKRKYVFIDVDNTPVPLYGHQELVKFNGHYCCNCYLPLLAFIDGFPVAVFNGNADGRKIMAAQFRQMVERIRERSPKSIVILRADRGFNSRALIDLCEELGCYYIIGLAPTASSKLCSMTGSRNLSTFFVVRLRSAATCYGTTASSMTTRPVLGADLAASSCAITGMTNVGSGILGSFKPTFRGKPTAVAETCGD